MTLVPEGVSVNTGVRLQVCPTTGFNSGLEARLAWPHGFIKSPGFITNNCIMNHGIRPPPDAPDALVVTHEPVCDRGLVLLPPSQALKQHVSLKAQPRHLSHHLHGDRWGGRNRVVGALACQASRGRSFPHP